MWSKFKASADNSLKVAHMMRFVQDRLENVVEKGENADPKVMIQVSLCKLYRLTQVKTGTVRYRHGAPQKTFNCKYE